MKSDGARRTAHGSSWLIATDLDGTLLEPDGTILPPVAAFLSEMRAAGHVLVLATGRRFRLTAEACRLMSAEPALVPDWIMANERDLHVLSESGEWETDDGHLLDAERALLAHARDARQRLELVCEHHGVPFTPYQTPDVEDERGFVGLAFTDEDAARRAVPLVTAELERQGIDLWVMRNRNGIVLRARDSAKGLTLLRLCRRLNIPPDRVVAIGDSHNDVDMLDGRHGFRSGCPANAEFEAVEAVRANDGVVSELPHGRGVIDVLERVLGSEF